MGILNLIGRLLLKLYVNIRIRLIFCLLRDQPQKFHFKSFGRVEIIRKFSNISSLSLTLEGSSILLLESRKEPQSFGEWLKWNDSIGFVRIQREISKRLWIRYKLYLIFSNIWFWEKSKSRFYSRKLFIAWSLRGFRFATKKLIVFPT